MNKRHIFDFDPSSVLTHLSYAEVLGFLEQINKIDPTACFSLPTEAQWEYACRAKTITPFHTGENITTKQANYDGSNPYKTYPKGEYRKKVIEPGTFAMNDWGLYDMHGNVWEWCLDWYGPYDANNSIDPIGPETGESRVLRGGSWLSIAEDCRSAHRSRLDPAVRIDSVGFRLVRADKNP